MSGRKTKLVRRQQRKGIKSWLGETMPLVREAERVQFAKGRRVGRMQAGACAVLAIVALCLVVLFVGGCEVSDSGLQDASDAGADAATDTQSDAQADGRENGRRSCPDTVRVVGYCNERAELGRACAKCSALKPGVSCLVNENIRCVFECRECAP